MICFSALCTFSIPTDIIDRLSLLIGGCVLAEFLSILSPSQSPNYLICFLDINLKTYPFYSFPFPFFTNFPLVLLSSLLHAFNYMNQNAKALSFQMPCVLQRVFSRFSQTQGRKKKSRRMAERNHGPLGICSSTGNSK